MSDRILVSTRKGLFTLARANGAVIGAVGISGDTGDCDELCAFAGLKAAGFDLENSK